MSYPFYLFAASAGLAASLAGISIWSPRPLWLKVSALVAAALFLPVTYIALVELLSRPKPINLEWNHTELAEAAVVGAELREGKNIYLWLRLAGVEEPRAYMLPWDQKLAEQLHGARQQANARNTAVRMKRPFMHSQDDRRPLFYALPQPARPPKQIPISNPLIYQP
ncbi:MAG: hypothetical protein ACE5LB_09130 [Acidiferrobacterales bacterium]